MEIFWIVLLFFVARSVSLSSVGEKRVVSAVHQSGRDATRMKEQHTAFHERLEEWQNLWSPSLEARTTRLVQRALETMCSQDLRHRHREERVSAVDDTLADADDEFLLRV